MKPLNMITLSLAAITVGGFAYVLKRPTGRAMTMEHFKIQEEVRELLTPAQFERRTIENELDGFPTNALVES